MKQQDLKHVTILEVLKKSKKAQQSALRLGKTEDWVILKQFVIDVKQVLMEASFESNKPLENSKYRNLIRGMEGIVLLPELVKFIKEQTKEDKESKREAKEDEKRKKYNPGAFMQRTFGKKK